VLNFDVVNITGLCAKPLVYGDGLECFYRPGWRAVDLYVMEAGLRELVQYKFDLQQHFANNLPKLVQHAFESGFKQPKAPHSIYVSNERPLSERGKLLDHAANKLLDDYELIFLTRIFDQPIHRQELSNESP
jgi:hypothetical protein